MPHIITTDSGEKCIRMRNGGIARPLPAMVPSNWTRLRVAVRVRLEETGNDYAGTPRFGIGLCSGGTDIIGDYTTTHFVGMVTNDATWTRTVSGATYYTINPVVAATKVGTTLTLGGNLSTSLVLQPAYSKLIQLDITKGSPNFTLNFSMHSSAQSNNAISGSNYDYVSAYTVPPPNAGHAAGGSSPTIAVDEGTNGALDHVCIWWDHDEDMKIFLVEAIPIVGS